MWTHEQLVCDLTGLYYNAERDFCRLRHDDGDRQERGGRSVG